MTGFLASVTGPDEAEIALAGGADIVDLKDPGTGALGALPLPVVEAAVAQIRQRRLTSATVGDLPPEPRIVVDAVKKMARTGVDIVKIGFFPGASHERLTTALAAQAGERRLIAVLFADGKPDFSLLENLAKVGFFGAMLDTATKNDTGLMGSLDLDQIQTFLLAARRLGLVSGLAGQLSVEEIPVLLPLRPDYLGFRSALCAKGRRAGQLDPDAIKRVRLCLPPTTDLLSPL